MNSDWKKTKNMFSPQEKLSLGRPANLRATLNKTSKHEPIYTRKLDLNMDEKKLRRIISNRLSAHRSRVRTSEYVKSMEKKVKDLQDVISFLTLQVDGYKEKRKELLVQNESLTKLVVAHCNESKISQTELQRKKLEILRLKELQVKASGEGSRLNQSTSKPYSLEFYQNGLQKLVSNKSSPGN